MRVGCTNDTGFIDDCHRLGKNSDRVIVTERIVNKFFKPKRLEGLTHG